MEKLTHPLPHGRLTIMQIPGANRFSVAVYDTKKEYPGPVATGCELKDAVNQLADKCANLHNHAEMKHFAAMAADIRNIVQ